MDIQAPNTRSAPASIWKRNLVCFGVIHTTGENMTLHLKLIDKAAFRELQAEWGPYLTDNLVKENYRPYMEYVERMLCGADANRKVYALVEEDEKCGYKYAVLTVSVRNEDGSGFGFPSNLRHPRFDKDAPSACLRRQITSRFIAEIIDAARTAKEHSVAIKLDGAVDRRCALADVPNSPNCFAYGDQWLFIKGFTRDESLVRWHNRHLNSGKSVKAKPPGNSSGDDVSAHKDHPRDGVRYETKGEVKKDWRS